MKNKTYTLPEHGNSFNETDVLHQIAALYNINIEDGSAIEKAAHKVASFWSLPPEVSEKYNSFIARTSSNTLRLFSKDKDGVFTGLIYFKPGTTVILEELEPEPVTQ
jgi:hypothetical protein